METAAAERGQEPAGREGDLKCAGCSSLFLEEFGHVRDGGAKRHTGQRPFPGLTHSCIQDTAYMICNSIKMWVFCNS